MFGFLIWEKIFYFSGLRQYHHHQSLCEGWTRDTELQNIPEKIFAAGIKNILFYLPSESISTRQSFVFFVWLISISCCCLAQPICNIFCWCVIKMYFLSVSRIFHPKLQRIQAKTLFSKGRKKRLHFWFIFVEFLG